MKNNFYVDLAKRNATKVVKVLKKVKTEKKVFQKKPFVFKRAFVR